MSNPVEGEWEDTRLLKDFDISVKIDFFHRNTDI